MDNSYKARILRAHRQLLNESASQTKKCYFINCKNPTIKAHSISNKRLLLKLSDNGQVMYFDKEAAFSGNIIETGRGKASTFSGFCGEHDKIFHPIDNEDYKIGNKQQEYLFALRAAAREFNTREAVGASIAARIDRETKDGNQGHNLDTEGLAIYRDFQKSFDIGTRDQFLTRGIFNDTFRKGKLNALQTAVVVVEGELPIAVSSSFNMELDNNGNLINDVSSEESSFAIKMKPTFLTVFPQEGKTYSLISYFRKDRTAYSFLHRLNDLSNTEKQILVSNLITSYTENFVANPTFWRELSPQAAEKYANIFGNSFKQKYAPLVADPEFNLFPDSASN